MKPSVPKFLTFLLLVVDVVQILVTNIVSDCCCFVQVAFIISNLLLKYDNVLWLVHVTKLYCRCLGDVYKAELLLLLLRYYCESNLIKTLDAYFVTLCA